MDFRILGTLHVGAGGRELRISGTRMRSLVAILLVNANRVVSEDVLIEGLWGEAATLRSSGNLHALVSRLRGILGKDRILREGNGYLLRVQPGELDLDRFQDLRAAGEPAQALALWRGPALAEFLYEPWAENEVRRLDELRLVTFEERIQRDLDAGRHAELVPELQALVADQPLRETLRRHLILALYQSERQAEALEAYRAARKMLDEELGLEPGPELRELERAVLRHDPSLKAPPRAPRVAAALGTRGQLAKLLTVPLALLGGFLGALAVIQLLGDESRMGSVAVAASKPVTTVQIRDSTRDTSTRRVVTVRRRSTARPRPVSPKPISEPPMDIRAVRRTKRTPPRELTSHSPKRKPRRRGPVVPVVAPNVYWLADYFEDPAFDFGLWHVAGHGAGVEAVERNGRLEFSVGSEVETDEENGADQHYATGCRLIGNFDARVEFELLDWPERNGMSLTLGAYFQKPDETFWSVSRGPDGYTTSVASIERAAASGDRKGTFRLRRANGVLTMYYRSQGHWVELAGGYAPGPTSLILSFNTSADRFGGKAARAAFDNFQATARGVSCAGYRLPPYKPAAIDM